jgi:hypothetical protein
VFIEETSNNLEGEMNKVVINNCYGKFSLSPAAVARLVEAGLKASEFSAGCSRHDPRLVTVIEEMGEAADGPYARLFVEEVEEELYVIQEYDGMECVITPSMMHWIKFGGE